MKPFLIYMCCLHSQMQTEIPTQALMHDQTIDGKYTVRRITASSPASDFCSRAAGALTQIQLCMYNRSRSASRNKKTNNHEL